MVKKSVLKSAALTVALAAAFSFMPAAQAEVPFFSSNDSGAQAMLPDFTKLVEENGKGVVNISTIRNARTQTVQSPFPGMDDRTASPAWMTARQSFSAALASPSSHSVPKSNECQNSAERDLASLFLLTVSFSRMLTWSKGPMRSAFV